MDEGRQSKLHQSILDKRVVCNVGTDSQNTRSSHYMTDSPYSDRIQAEIGGARRLWRKYPKLSLTIGIGALLYFGYALYEKFVVLQEISRLRTEVQDLKSTNHQLETDLRLTRVENTGLRETVAPLLKQAATQFPGEEINVSLKKVIAQLEAINPTEQPLRTATATITVRVKSSENVQADWMDSGGYLALGKGTKPIVVTGATTSHGHQDGTGQVVFTGVFEANQANIPPEQKVSSLSEAEYVQLSFGQMPKHSTIVGGNAVLILNNSVRLQFSIPPQVTDDEGRIFVKDLGLSLSPVRREER